MKTKVDAVKTLLDAGWSVDEIKKVLDTEKEEKIIIQYVGYPYIVTMPAINPTYPTYPTWGTYEITCGNNSSTYTVLSNGQ